MYLWGIMTPVPLTHHDLIILPWHKLLFYSSKIPKFLSVVVFDSLPPVCVFFRPKV